MKRAQSPSLMCWLAVALLLALSQLAPAQVIRGAIEGNAADQAGAVIPGAKVTLKNAATGAEINATTNDRGAFSFQNLEAGVYIVTVEKNGFRKYQEKGVTVKVGAVTPVTATLQVGETSQVIEVTSSTTDASVDNARATVDGVITAKQIDNLPLNGRNFLDLAQLEPGVQVRDGGDFDPTKNQMSGVSIGGRSGRATRIQVDGVDITDETVGTTTTNLSNESIQEFQLSRSSLDASTDLTSSGAVNIVTRSGSNQIHGSGFGFFRNESYAADLRLDKTSPTTAKPPFERQNFGGRAGGYFIKDKLFWHLEAERTRQNAQQFTAVTPFPQFTSAFGVPLRETFASGRLDWVVTDKLKAFYRFSHNHNSGVTGFGLNDLSAFANQNNTNFHVTGADYSTAHWTHALRFSYLNFNNGIVDANAAAGTPKTLDPAGKPLLVNIRFQLTVGADLLAPQQTFQDNKQVKYDGSWVIGNHTLRFGSSFNKIAQGGFASFFGLAPRIRANYNAGTIDFAKANGGVGNPLNFPLTQIVLGNGLGFGSEKPAHNLPFGGFYNNRFGAYIQDNWKITPNFSANFGVRYVFDSNIANNDLPRTPTLAAFHPDLAGKVDRPNLNFAPQAGFAWDVRGNGKTVIRGGAGIFYETNIINNALFDRSLNLPPGLGNDTPVLNAASPKLLNPATGACLFDITKYSPTVGNCNGALNLLGQPLRNVIGAAQNMQAVLQQVTAGLAANYPPKGVAPLFDQTLDASSLIYNKYQRPYGIMFNIGVQRELKPGLVLSVDYLRNRGVHFNQGINLNRIGAANTLHVPTARQIISDVNNEFGCGPTATAAAINCAITAGATIADYADFGLDAGSGLDGFAFSGVNRNYRNISVIAPVGLSTYNGLSVNLRGRLGKFWIIKDATTVVSYALSRFESTAGDQDFLAGSFSNDSPTKFFGPNGLDRTHQFTFSFLTELPWGFKVNTTTRLASGLPVTILLPQHSATGAGEIFFTDLDGDGTTDDLLPGTNVGAFGRGVGVGRLNSLISDFNGTVTTAFTPAARALVAAGLFTEGQLRALGATVNGGETLALAPLNQVPTDRFSNTDVRVSRVFKFFDDGRMRFEPMVEVFNLFNVGNYDTPGSFLNGTLDGSTGSINGTTKRDRVNRYGLGSGSFAPGIPRAFQFGFRLEF